MRKVNLFAWTLVGLFNLFSGISSAAVDCMPHPSAPKWAQSIEQLKALTIPVPCAEASQYSFNSKSLVKAKKQTFFVLMEVDGSGHVVHTAHIFKCRLECVVIATRTSYDQPLDWELNEQKNTLLITNRDKQLLLAIPIP